MRIEHSTIAMLIITRADLIVIEEVIVIVTIGILDKDGITIIKVQAIKQLRININGDAKLWNV